MFSSNDRPLREGERRYFQKCDDSRIHYIQTELKDNSHEVSINKIHLRLSFFFTIEYFQRRKRNLVMEILSVMKAMTNLKSCKEKNLESRRKS